MYVVAAREPFELMYAQQVPLVRWYLRTRDRGEDIDDVVAEVFLVAWRRRESLPTSPDACSAWLLAVARKTLANNYRSTARRARLHDRLVPLRIEEGDGPQLAIELDPTVERGLQLLPASDRQLFELIADPSMDLDAVARELECSRAALRTRIFRARRRFAAAYATCSADAAVQRP